MLCYGQNFLEEITKSEILLTVGTTPTSHNVFPAQGVFKNAYELLSS